MLQTQPSCINYFSELNTFGLWLSQQGQGKAALPRAARACGFQMQSLLWPKLRAVYGVQNPATCCDTAAGTFLQGQCTPVDTFLDGAPEPWSKAGSGGKDG